MGQAQSQQHRKDSTECLSQELAEVFATKCFTPLEFTHFKDNFRTLADRQDGINFRVEDAHSGKGGSGVAHDQMRYWKEETLARFLQLPASIPCGAVVYQMSTYLGAFPFPSLAPSILTIEALVKVVVIMTERYGKVLKRGKTDRNKLLFRSLAVFDRTTSSKGRSASDELGLQGEGETMTVEEKPESSASGFSIDQPGNEEDDIDDEDLALAAIESLDAIEAFQPELSNHDQSQPWQIPRDNFRHLLMLLLVAASLSAQESLSQHTAHLMSSRTESIRRAADDILEAFMSEQPGISWPIFHAVVTTSLPFLFDGLNPLFEHFLFSKNIDLSRRRNTDPDPLGQHISLVVPMDISLEPLLPLEGEILNLTTLSQLSFFIKSTNLFHRLRPLYVGSTDGFSLGSFEQKVLNWRAPTILLVAGTRIGSSPSSAGERSFADKLPPKRFPDASHSQQSSRLVFGAYLRIPWKQTFKEAIGDSETLLFQLDPIHEVFRASSVNRSYATFTKSGITFGCPPPRTKPISGLDAHTELGPVSLILDDSLEYGAFTHDSAGGGAFYTSRTRKTDWQDRFEIEAIEVWGCGGDEEAERQRKAWAWEEREASQRRGLNLGKDVEADRALLEMAGIIRDHGTNSGGSMG